MIAPHGVTTVYLNVPELVGEPICNRSLCVCVDIMHAACMIITCEMPPSHRIKEFFVRFLLSPLCILQCSATTSTFHACICVELCSFRIFSEQKSPLSIHCKVLRLIATREATCDSFPPTNEQFSLGLLVWTFADEIF